MTAFALPASARGTGDGHGNAWNSNCVASTLSAGGHPDSNLPGRHHEDDDNLIVASMIDEGMARPLVARASGYRMDLESETFVVANPIRASDGHHGWSGPRGDGDDNLVIADPISAHEGKTYTHEGRNNFRTHNVVEVWDDRNQAATEDVHHTLRGAGLQRSDVLNSSAGVRRLTPLECERLQGFPDGWTDLVVGGKPIADAHRYRMLGNAVDTVVAQWLGHRLVWVDAQLHRGDPYWYPVRDGDAVARGLFMRHYSSTLKRRQPRRPVGNGEKFCGPGQHMVLLGSDARALFVWRLQRYRKDGQAGVECTVFRNEGVQLSSALIREAAELARQRWPEQRRHFTFVEPVVTRRRRSRHARPGQCFIHAGWQPCGETTSGLAVLESW